MIAKLMRRGKLSALVAGQLAAALSGCMASGPKSPPLPPACMDACEAVPSCCRGNVYAFLINGFDPFDLAAVERARDGLNRAGFARVYAGQVYHTFDFVCEMRAIARNEPDARFVVVGVGAGLVGARSLAESVGGDGSGHGLPRRPSIGWV
jgi:hypothetical protein